jgi:hypothetical protein
MVPEPSTSATIDSEQSPGSSNTIVNAFIGAVVSIVSGFFLPFFSPVVGGGVAGYLEGGDSEHGAKVGAISGGFASIPIVLIGLVVLSFLFGAPRAAIGVFGFIIIVFGLAFTIGLSALGGLLGVYVKDEM